VTEEERLAEVVERLIGVIIRQRGSIPGPEPRQLTTTQALALLTLADEGPLRLGALADRIATTGATASRTVDVLESLGFVARRPAPLDGRGITVEPTAAGRREVRRRRERVAAMVAELLKGLPPDEQRRFVDLLDDLNDLLIGVDRGPVRA
jgi:DNA-binding MarR family transcriptional regulator